MSVASKTGFDLKMCFCTLFFSRPPDGSTILSQWENQTFRLFEFQHLTDVFVVHQNQEEVRRLFQEVAGYFLAQASPILISFGFPLHHPMILLHSPS